MTVRSLGLALVLALTALACSEPDSSRTPDEPAVGGLAKGDKPTPATDKPASSKEGASTPATDTPATKTTATDKAVDTATTPDANKAAQAGNADPAAALATLKACITSCGNDAACAKTCVTDLAAGAGLPELPGGG